MAAFENGVVRYVLGVGTISNNFPVDKSGAEHVCCEFCDFYSTQSKKCRVTGEIIYKPGAFVGVRCPLDRANTENEKGE